MQGLSHITSKLHSLLSVPECSTGNASSLFLTDRTLLNQPCVGVMGRKKRSSAQSKSEKGCKRTFLEHLHFSLRCTNHWIIP